MLAISSIITPRTHSGLGLAAGVQVDNAGDCIALLCGHELMFEHLHDDHNIYITSRVEKSARERIIRYYVCVFFFFYLCFDHRCSFVNV